MITIRWHPFALVAAACTFLACLEVGDPALPGVIHEADDAPVAGSGFDIAQGGTNRDRHWQPRKGVPVMLLPEYATFCTHLLPLWRIARWDIGIDQETPYEWQDECRRLVVHFFLPYVDKDMRHIFNKTMNLSRNLANCSKRAKQNGTRAGRGVLLMLPVYKSAFTEVRCNLARAIDGLRGEKQGAGTPFLLSCPPDGDLEPSCRAGSSGGRCLEEGRAYPEPPWSFAFIRDPFKRFASGYSELEYFLTVGPPELFSRKRPKNRRPPEELITQTVRNCQGCGFLSKPENSIERAKEFIHDLLHLKLTNSPLFLWRHVFSQLGIMHGYNRVFDRRVEFVGSLESMNSSWFQLLGLVQARPRPFDRTCDTHNYSNAKSGFKAREMMTLLLKGTGSDDRHEAYVRALECAVLLPDKVCLGYDGVVGPSDCVKHGYAESMEDWEAMIQSLRKLCPRAAPPHRDVF